MKIGNTFFNLNLENRNFIKSNIEKTYRLIKILNYFNSDSFFKDKFALKGGTAINLTQVPPLRLSVDIDLDLTKTLNKEETNLLKEEFENKFTKYITLNNYTLPKSIKKTYALLSFQLYYVNAWGNKDSIKVEINFLDRAHILPLENRQPLINFGEPNLNILTLNTTELYASKINALTSRAAPRDLYDVNTMIEKSIIEDTKMLKKCLIFYNMVGGKQDIDNIDFTKIQAINYNMVKRQLKPVLDKKDKFNLDEAKENVINYLKALIKLDDDEIKFIKEFRQNNYDPSLLFENDEIIKNIINHPMALWRCKNNIIYTETIDNIE